MKSSTGSLFAGHIGPFFFFLGTSSYGFVKKSFLSGRGLLGGVLIARECVPLVLRRLEGEGESSDMVGLRSGGVIQMSQ